MVSPLKIVKIPAWKMLGMSIYSDVLSINPSRLWQKFMPEVKHLQPCRFDRNLYAVQYFDDPPNGRGYGPETKMQFWAGVRIKNDPESLPEGIHKFEIDPGTYAVFIHTGPAARFPETMRSILEDWLPASDYQLAHRAQFQLMPPDYKGPLHPEAREEVWVPVEPK